MCYPHSERYLPSWYNRDEETRLSAAALTLLLEPEASPEYREELVKALESPALFTEMLDEFGRDVPSDDALVSYLVRKKNIGEPAAKTLIRAFRESLDLVDSKTALFTGLPEPSNATEVNRAKEPPNPMSTQEISTQAKGVSLSLSWSLSPNTALLIQVVGPLPSHRETSKLPTLLEWAKEQILDEVNKAATPAGEGL